MSQDAPHRFDLVLPRHAVSPRQVARGGEIWRLMQEAAVLSSGLVGWPAERYLAEGVAFIVASMTVRHRRELRYGEAVSARTWIRANRRGTISYREVRLEGEDGPVADATQQWVHVSLKDGELRPARGSEAVQAAFRPIEVPGEAPVELPEWQPIAENPPWAFNIDVWHSWMDPLGHVNHPTYLDWCDEALMRRLALAGLDPQDLRPVAERVRYRQAAMAGDRVVVESRLNGLLPGGEVAVEQRILRESDATLLAEVSSIRGLGSPQEDALRRALS